MRVLVSVTLAAMLFSLTPNGLAADITIEFSDIALGTTFPSASLPTTIAVDGADVTLSKYNSSASANGAILDMPIYGSISNNAFFLAADLRAEITMPAPSFSSFFRFRDGGGTNLLEINGQILSFSDPLLAGPGTVIDVFGGLGFHSFANNPLKPEIRSVKIFGTVTSLAFIGQELTIDSISLALVPEPSTCALAALGVIGLLAFKRRKR
jgi:hypothetical protein